MRISKPSFLRSLALASGLLGCGMVNAQQASFAVAVTLHTTMSKPLSVEQLCTQQPKPIDVLGARIQVDCPVAAKDQRTVKTNLAAAPRPAPPEVLVTF